MKSVQQAILEEDINELQKLLPANSNHFYKKFDFKSNHENVISLQPLEAAILCNRVKSIEYFRKLNVMVSSDFMTNHFKAEKASQEVKNLLPSLFYSMHDKFPGLNYDYSTPGSVKKWLSYDFNSLFSRDFIETAVTNCDGDDFQTLLHLGAKLPSNIPELLTLICKKNNAGLINYWKDKLKILASTNVLDPDTNAKLAESILKNELNLEIFISANINWEYQIASIKQVIVSDENSSGNNKNPIVTYQLLLDKVLRTDPNLIRKIPPKKFNINALDPQGLSFLHKAIRGYYSDDPNVQTAVIKSLIHCGINPLLCTHSEKLSAFQLAERNNRSDLAQAITNYTIQYLKTHPSVQLNTDPKNFGIMESDINPISQPSGLKMLQVLTQKVIEMESTIKFLTAKVTQLEMTLEIMQTTPLAEGSKSDDLSLNDEICALEATFAEIMNQHNNHL